MEENNSFKPYVSADKVLPEFTPSSIIIGVLLAIVFGAANAYLGPVSYTHLTLPTNSLV